MNFRSRQAKSIVGMAFAVLGGVAWYFQLYIPAAILWGAAMVIVFSLNKRRKQRQRR
jgi:Flp pilus assembly protein TadB